MQLALEWATTNHPEYLFTICTDSQSLLKAIEGRSPVTHHLRSLVNARPGPTSLLWIPGHPQGVYGSTTDNSEDSGGVWRVLLVQGLHGH